MQGKKKRRRSVHLHVMVTPEEQRQIQERMAQAGILNMGAYMRKIALNGYVLQVDLSPVRELVSLQRRCANNLNQAALHVNTYGGLYPNELQALQKDYADFERGCCLWRRPVSYSTISAGASRFWPLCRTASTTARTRKRPWTAPGNTGIF